MILSLREVGEYKFQIDQEKNLFRVTDGNKYSKWIPSRFFRGLFLSPDRKFKNEIDKRLERY
jgi:hypothetical protein